MLKKIVGTAGTRILNAAINLVILLLITNKIGSEGFGIIALIMVDITVIQMFIDLLAGSALIYFSSRANLGQLILPAYLWIGTVILLFFLASVFTQAVFPVVHATVIPAGYEIHILMLALLNALMITHYNLLLGREEIKVYNIIFTVQILTLLGVFLYGILGQHNFSPVAYVYALYFAYGIGSILGFVVLVRKTGKFIIKGWTVVLKKVINFGFISFVANIVHIGNKRLSFYVLRYFAGLSALGVYNTGVQLTEGLRIIGQSISLVQFSTISNTADEEYAKSLTIKLMKFTLILTFAALLLLIILPGSVYTWIFSKNFTDVKPIILALSPGVMALAANNIFSHYFSGLGNPKVNMWSNFTGLVFTVVLAFTLIPAFGYLGAALTASVSYTVTVIYQYIIFRKKTQTRLVEWLPKRQDFADFIKLTRDALAKNNK
jgi:O-antigen/teichoic acid export membrane protein